MTNSIPNLTLANGVEMPALGLGVFLSSPEETVAAVTAALDTGYRLIDTAAVYGNEAQVGEAIRQSALARDDIFITTKMWIGEYGYDSGLAGFDRSMRKLGLETLDLYLLHQPMPTEWDRTVEAWKAAAHLLEQGRVRAIGVSNFNERQLTDLTERTGAVPQVNQVEVHPFFIQSELRRAHERLGIATQAWSPIGGVMRYFTDDPDVAQSPLSHPAVTGIAQRHGKTPAQIILRWHLQHGICAIPKSVRPARIAENFAVFDFSLDADEMAAIDALDTGNRSGPNPAEINTTTYPHQIAD